MINFDILINGSKLNSIIPERGIWQGDHLSPFLFILCSEIFLRLVEKNNDIKASKLVGTHQLFSHLLYANDILMACQANPQNAAGIQEVLTRYSNWSDQAPNFDKS